MKKNEGQQLRVAECKPKDAGRGIARIDPAVMAQMGLETGDVVAIDGGRTTVAKCWRGYPEDSNSYTIRLDSSLRKNADVGIDDTVTIRKVEPKVAKTVTFAPTEAVRLEGGEEYLRNLLEGQALIKGDSIDLNIMGRKLELIVVDTSPRSDAVIISLNTKVLVKAKPVKGASSIERIAYEDIGGLDEEIKKVREMIELPMRHPELFEALGVDPPKGVLLHGPPGTGKTLLAKAVANETHANFVNISGPEVMSKFYGESEANIREIFEQAKEDAPSIIFIDEIDSIAPKRDEVQGEVERRVVAQLLSIMDGLNSRGKVVVIGATNRPNALDPALRRGGRFDREIEIGIPNLKGRLDILHIHTRGMPLAEDVFLDDLSRLTHGYTGADISALCKEAAMRALRKASPRIDLEADVIPVEVLRSLKINKEDFDVALRESEPSALREVVVESPNVRWDDIGGLDEIKEELRESIEWPLHYKELFDHMGAEDAKGILLYGPPGTGKTLLAKAVATESEVNFISVKGPEFLSKWVGESEKAVRETFRKARQASPCIIFFDEIDAIAPARGTSCDSHTSERIISQILTELDGLIKLHNVKVIAATNRPDIIDQALLRSGRFDRHIYIPLPDETTRRAIFVVHSRKRPLAKDVDLDMLAARTDGYTGADIAALCNEATMMAIREQVAGAGPSGLKGDALNDKVIHMKNFDEAMKRVRPMSKSELMRYEAFARMFGSHGPSETADACGCSDGDGKSKKAKDEGGKAYQ